jgi:hypothetical protein
LLLWATFFLLIPSKALAWGPAAHLEFGLIALKDLALLAPAVAVLLKKFPEDFHYGCMAADITLGKFLSPYHLHCHNWQVGFTVLERAESDRTRAFAWGYLSHLAADTVAHNYFVPYKIIEQVQRRRAYHAYWEIRFDARVKEETWELARRLSTRAFKEHDRFMRKILIDPFPLLPFRVNKQIFNSMVVFNRLLRWQRMVKEQLSRKSRSLSDEEVEEIRGLCTDRVIDLLRNGAQAACLLSDPTGYRNIIIARDVRKRLRELHLQGRLLNPGEIGERFKQLFREALNDDKLSLPSLQELTDLEVTPVRRRRRLRRKKEYRKPRFVKLRQKLRRKKRS